MVIKVVCLDNKKLLANTACNLVNLIREEPYPEEPRRGHFIQVQKLKKEGVNGTYFDGDDDDDGEGRFKDFVKIFFGPKWDKWDICLEYIHSGRELNYYLDKHLRQQKWDKWDICLEYVHSGREPNYYLDKHLRHGDLELVFFFNDGFKPDDLMQSLWKNGQHISRALREPHGNKKVLVTLFVSSENK